MKKVKIIGISGKIGSGKDTFAEELAKIINFRENNRIADINVNTTEFKVAELKVEKYAFADKLRENVQLITGFEMSEILTHPFYNKIYTYTHEQKNTHLPLWDKTIGECLQVMGTEAMREGFDYDVWVKSLFATHGEGCLKRDHIMVIADARFPNEADYILKQGGVVIRLEGDPMNVRANSTRDLNHISEIALDDYKNFSRVVTNLDPDIGLFTDKIAQIINDFNIG